MDAEDMGAESLCAGNKDTTVAGLGLEAAVGTTVVVTGTDVNSIDADVHADVDVDMDIEVDIGVDVDVDDEVHVDVDVDVDVDVVAEVDAVSFQSINKIDKH